MTSAPHPMDAYFPVPRGWRRAASVAIPLGAIGGAIYAARHDLVPTTDAAVMLAILLWVAGYWATEVIPAVATSLLAIGLVIIGLGIAPALLRTPASDALEWSHFLTPAASPVMLLMLGSLMLSEGCRRTGVDAIIGVKLLRPFATSPRRLVLGVLLVAAWLSMWTSNTATAAILLSVTRPLWTSDELDASFRGAIVLAIAVGANIGGIATPVGSPPNAIVFGTLNAAGYGVNFLRWMLLGLPVAGALLGVAWVVLARGGAWTHQTGPVTLTFAPTAAPRWSRAAMMAVFCITVLLWITSPWTRLPVSVAALVPAVLLPAMGILRPQDLARLDWDVLLLIAGGLVLGEGLAASGLAAAVAQAIPMDVLPGILLVAALALLALVLSSFMSNTAVANLLCPLGLGIAVAFPGGEGQGWLMREAGLAIAFASGAAMVLPVSTPPNALTYRTGLIPLRRLIGVGLLMGMGACACVVIGAWLRA